MMKLEGALFPWRFRLVVGLLGIMVAVGVFLAIQAAQALSATGVSFLTTAEWQPDRGEFGIAAVMLGTVLIALVAGAIALPIALGTALGEFELAHRGFGFNQQRRTGFGEADFALLADKQARAQAGFHVLDLPAQGRRGDA